MKIYVVTVTYGNRFHLLKQVIDGVLSEDVAKIIVVDNNSNPESRDKLGEYEKQLNGKIKVLYLDDNYGSAGGFKRGLEEAYNDVECEFIWLLDDDNVPEKKALEKLIYAYKYLGENQNNILVSFRESRQVNVKAIYLGEQVGYKTNSFTSFHILYWLKSRINSSIKYKNTKNYCIVRSQVAAYGGLFLAKTVINEVGYPDEDFFIYADDHDWTLRMTKRGLNIYLCSESRLKDIDWTWTATREKNSSCESSDREYKVYYTIRNHVYLDKNFIKNKYVYYINMIIKFFYFYFLHPYLKTENAIKRIKIIVKAIKDGLKGKLGNTFNKVSMENENFCGKKIESDFLNTIRKRGGNHGKGQE